MPLLDKRFYYVDNGGEPPEDTEIIFQGTMVCILGNKEIKGRGIKFAERDEHKNNWYWVTKLAEENLKAKYRWQ